MNDTPTTDGEISKDTTAEPIESDATEKKRKSLKDLKETTPPQKKGTRQIKFNVRIIAK
jgi:hypothetical protein